MSVLAVRADYGAAVGVAREVKESAAARAALLVVGHADLADGSGNFFCHDDNLLF